MPNSRFHPSPCLLVCPALIALSLAFATNAGAQVSPLGGEFQVNSYTTNRQWTPAVAIDAEGNLVVTWASNGSNGSDTSSQSALAQRFDVNGAPLGGEFQVNTYTTNAQVSPSVAVDAQGNFVIAWTSSGSTGTDSSSTSVHAQRYDSSGTPVGGDFQVNSYTTSYQTWPDIALDPQGNFVIAWASYGSSGTDTSGWSVLAQRYNASGTPVGGEFQVNGYTTGAQSPAGIASDSQGNFVVVWESEGSSGTDSDGYSIQARRYSADGNPLGGEFQVNSYTTNNQYRAAVASDSQGNFVVAWASYGSSGTDTSDWSVQARRFAANGTPLGGQFQVNSYTTNYQKVDAVVSDAEGNFVVVWVSDGSSDTDTDNQSIQAQRFDANGTPLGGQFQVNTYTTFVQWFASAAANAQGKFVVSWTSFGSSGTDSSDQSVQARRYSGAYFYDGFESGDTSRWSATSP